MHGEKKRIETASAKVQTKLKPYVMYSSVVINNGVRGKKGEKSRKKAEREDGIKAHVEITNHIPEVEGVQYFDILDGKGRLPLRWKDLYELVSAGRVPQSWRNVFEESVHLSESMKQEATIMKH